MKRGVIAAPGIIATEGGASFPKRALAWEELNYYVMYWDKVVIPTSNIIYMELPDEDVLVQTGVISRPKVRFEGSFENPEIARVFALTQARAAEDLVKNESDTEWVIHQVGPDVVLPPEYQALNRSVRVDLANLLPVPGADTPIVDIVDFKSRRKDELSALHAYLDDLYQEILRSPDPTLEGKAAITRLKTAITNLEKVSQERWKTTEKFDFSVELNIDGGKIVAGAAAGAAYDFYSPSGIQIPIGTIFGGLASVLKVSAKVSLTYEPAKKQNKLAYLSHANNEKLLAAKPRTAKTNPAATRTQMLQHLHEILPGFDPFAESKEIDIFAEARKQLAKLREKDR